MTALHPEPDLTVPCETCNGRGHATEFRRFAGEYQAGEPYDVPCHDCDGTGEWPADCVFCDAIAVARIDGEYLCQRHAADEGLTEVHGDPMLGRVA